MRTENRPSPESLAVLRLLVCVNLLWATRPLAWIGSLPQELFNPPAGLPQLWSGFPSTGILRSFEVAGFVLVVLVGIGWKTRGTSLLLFLWAVGTSSIGFSLGKIDHSFIFWLTVALLGQAGWGDAFSVDARQRQAPKRPTWPLGALALILALGFLTAVAPKIAGGWLSPSTHATEGYFRSGYLNGRSFFLADTAFGVHSGPLWEILDIFTVIFELAVPATVFNQRWFRRMLIVATGFHIGVLLVMNISFHSLMIVYAALLAGPQTARSLRRFNDRIVARGVFGLVGTFALWRMFLIISQDQSAQLLAFNWGIKVVFFLAVLAVVLWFERTGRSIAEPELPNGKSTSDSLGQLDQLPKSHRDLAA